MYRPKDLFCQLARLVSLTGLTATMSESLIMASTSATESTILSFVFDWKP